MTYAIAAIFRAKFNILAIIFNTRNLLNKYYVANNGRVVSVLATILWLFMTLVQDDYLDIAFVLQFCKLTIMMVYWFMLTMNVEYLSSQLVYV
ncbi:unnamed protein product [Paramecium octaurelia]|uniref:Uncharacterized protein n=1 Tax=Paramecium octaurelia TaxID=43137 RepID=A0A8S1XEQ5_PAROT|nr:unnamed protein product [Paramecium octaurelia]